MMDGRSRPEEPARAGRDSTASRGRRRWLRRAWIVFATILVATALCYFRAPTCSLTYDDHELITGNDFLKGWMADAPGVNLKPVDYISKMLTADFAALAYRAGQGDEDQQRRQRLNYYRPVIAASYMVDTLVWGEIPRWKGGTSEDRITLEWSRLNPTGYHLTNLLFHALNSVLVFALARSLFRRGWAGLAAGLVFAVHPMHTESVTWISGRTDVIATTFFLASFWTYLRFRRRARGGWLAASLALFVVGTFTKEMVAVLPPVLLLLEIIQWLGRRRAVNAARPPAKPAASLPVAPSAAARELRQGLVAVAAFFVLLLPYFLLKAAFTPASSMPPELLALNDTWRGVGLGTIVATLPSALGWYVGKLVWPVHFNLYPMPPFHVVADVGSWLPWCLLHLALVGGGVVLALRRSTRLLGFCVLGLYVSFGPLTCLIPGARLARFPVDIQFPVSERFLYIPSVFLALAVGSAVAWFTRRETRVQRSVVAVGLAILVAVSAWIVDRRNHDWKDNLAVFGASVRASPDSIRMRLNLGAALTLDVWEVEEGRRHFARALEIADDRKEKPPAELLSNLSQNAFLRGELETAASYLTRSFELLNRDPNLGYNMAVTLSVYGTILSLPAMLHQAAGLFEHVCRFKPGDEMARQSFGFTRETLAFWRRYFAAPRRTDEVALPFAMGFDLSSEGLGCDTDPLRRLQGLWVLDAGFSRLSPLAEVEALPRTGAVVRKMMERLRVLDRDLSVYFEGLLARFPDRPALQFLLAEVNRVAGHWLDAPERLDRARRLYEAVLARRPGHGEAALGLIAVLTLRGQDEAARQVARQTVHELLREDRTWEGRPVAAWPAKALEVADRGAAGGARASPRSGAKTPAPWEALVRETWEGSLDVAARQAARQRQGRDWAAWNYLGVLEARAADVLKRSELLDRALNHLARALEIDPGSETALQNLIQVNRKLGRHGDVRQLEKQLEAVRRERASRSSGNPR